MATTKKAAAPKKQSQGFQGVRGAFWIIVVCAIYTNETKLTIINLK